MLNRRVGAAQWQRADYDGRCRQCGLELVPQKGLTRSQMMKIAKDHLHRCALIADAKAQWQAKAPTVNVP
jgi:hypothetical protein